MTTPYLSDLSAYAGRLKGTARATSATIVRYATALKTSRSKTARDVIVDLIVKEANDLADVAAEPVEGSIDRVLRREAKG